MHTLTQIRKALDSTNLSTIGRLAILGDFTQPLDELINFRGSQRPSLPDAGYRRDVEFNFWQTHWIQEHLQRDEDTTLAVRTVQKVLNAHWKEYGDLYEADDCIGPCHESGFDRAVDRCSRIVARYYSVSYEKLREKFHEWLYVCEGRARASWYATHSVDETSHYRAIA